MDPETDRGSDYAPNEWAFEARNRLNREFFALVRREREEANIQPDYDAHWDEEDGYFRGVPASSKAMVGLHMPALDKIKEKNCAVCLEDFKEGDELRMMPCIHSFNQRCIFDWLRISGVCPCCRFALPSTHEQHFLDKQAARVQDQAGVN